MITWKQGVSGVLLLFAATFMAPGYADAQLPLPEEGAVLYELNENMSLRALKNGRRRATSQLLGFAKRGTPLCPEVLVIAVSPSATHCALNATGTDNISLVTGLGIFFGDFEVVVQEVNPETGNQTPDSPEVVVARGRFEGKMDFSPAILQQIPLGTVAGKLWLNGFSRKTPFTGVFRLPFLHPAVAGDVPLYLLDLETFTVVPVGVNEMAIGFPTVRFEISF
jgi:hypothetical protein